LSAEVTTAMILAPADISASNDATAKSGVPKNTILELIVSAVFKFILLKIL